MGGFLLVEDLLECFLGGQELKKDMTPSLKNKNIRTKSPPTRFFANRNTVLFFNTP